MQHAEVEKYIGICIQYSVRMQGNSDQNNSEYTHVLSSDNLRRCLTFNNDLIGSRHIRFINSFCQFSEIFSQLFKNIWMAVSEKTI